MFNSALHWMIACGLGYLITQQPNFPLMLVYAGSAMIYFALGFL